MQVSLAAPVPLVKGQTYYLVSQETSGGDAFYAAALKQPCAGSIGPGGTAPRLNLLSVRCSAVTYRLPHAPRTTLRAVARATEALVSSQTVFLRVASVRGTAV